MSGGIDTGYGTHHHPMRRATDGRDAVREQMAGQIGEMKAAIEIRGNNHLWSLDLANVTPENLRDWQADGLEVHEVVAEYPVSDEHVERIREWSTGGQEQ